MDMVLGVNISRPKHKTRSGLGTLDEEDRHSFQKATRRRTKTWTLKVLIGSIIIVFSLGGVGRASGKASERLRGAGRQGRTDNFEEKIFCRTSSPIRANRDEILKFIESFCAEATGQEFGGSEGNLELKELYSVEPSQRANEWPLMSFCSYDQSMDASFPWTIPVGGFSLDRLMNAISATKPSKVDLCPTAVPYGRRSRWLYSTHQAASLAVPPPGAHPHHFD
ncbi:hypothetical protein PSTT_15451, partial [Puccinia striiformis]